MLNRAFILATVVLWLGSMAWLVVDKIMPSFYDGDLPVASGLNANEPVAWEVEWSGKHVGFAVSLLREGIQGTTEVHNQLALDEVPMLELAPAWMRSTVEGMGNLRFVAKTRIEFDSLDNFSAFESGISINDVAGIVKMSGRVKESDLHLKIQSGTLNVSHTITIPDQAALNEALFPDAKLPYMYVGRHWQEQVYNPFANPSEPIDRVDANVVEAELIEHGVERKRVLRVDYHSSSAVGVSDKARLRAQTWVLPNGVVLKQVVYLANAKLSFRRLEGEKVTELANKFFPLLMSEAKLRKEIAGKEKPALP
ncbi:MAG: hypothetical protein RH917_15200 [Lacipirellulaceae bacterium]